MRTPFAPSLAIAVAFALTFLSLASCECIPAADSRGWHWLIDGQDAVCFRPSEFGGQGEVRHDGGALILGKGNSMTGITFDAEFPKTNYEVEARTARLAGGDFFCALTFPVGESHCSLVLGGWGGELCGLSSLDDMDASENRTTKFIEFVEGRFYDVRVQVTPTHIRAWLDDQKIIDADITEQSPSVRWEVEPSRPLGIASYETEAAFTKLRYRTLR